jgi:hypothetical protein
MTETMALVLYMAGTAAYAGFRGQVESGGRSTRLVALFDPARNTVNLVPVPPRVIVGSAGWTPDGAIHHVYQQSLIGRSTVG